MGLGERRGGGRRHGHRHHGHRHHGHRHHGHRIGGIGGRRRFRFGFRRRRRIVRRRRGHGGSGGALKSLLCCFGCFGGTQQTAPEANQNDIEQLQNFQMELMAARQQHQQTTNGPVAGQETLENAAIQQGVQQLQQEQRELLDDIMRQQAKENDAQKLQELFNQQNVVIRQMSALQSEGFQYQGVIPPEANIQPMDTSERDPPPSYASLYQT